MSNTFTENMSFGQINRSAAFKPTLAFPMDTRSYFNKLSDAEAAAAKAEGIGSSDTVYYYGLDIVVVDNNIATKYIIQPPDTDHATGWLKEVGSSVTVDEISIGFNSNGQLEIKDYGDRYYRYAWAKSTSTGERPEADASNYKRWYKGKVDGVDTWYECVASETEPITYSWRVCTNLDEDVPPSSDYIPVNGFIDGLEPKVVTENGKLVIAWFEPNPTTAEGLASQITSLSTSVTNINAAVNTLKGGTEVTIAQCVQAINVMNNHLNDQGAGISTTLGAVANIVTQLTWGSFEEEEEEE